MGQHIPLALRALAQIIVSQHKTGAIDDIAPVDIEAASLEYFVAIGGLTGTSKEVTLYGDVTSVLNIEKSSAALVNGGLGYFNLGAVEDVDALSGAAVN